MKKILITGAVGFIGYHLSKKLLANGNDVLGVDNINDYYDVNLKLSRLSELETDKNFKFIKLDISEKEELEKVFQEFKPQIVINLAAQAGVRYSITNPDVYIKSNLIGFYNVLESCRYHKVEHLLYASSSSVYGANKKVPFSTEDKTDSPVSLYAATKKSNELLANAYSHLYDIPCTGLRFFTVYGPYGRPDMAYFSFTKKILSGETINVFNNGDMYRDFTYIDDIVNAIVKMVNCPPKVNENGDKHKVYNIGNNTPEKLMDMISFLEEALNMKAKINFMPMQAGDVYQTYADVDELQKDFDFKPDTSLKYGITQFVKWYLEYYGF